MDSNIDNLDEYNISLNIDENNCNVNDSFYPSNLKAIWDELEKYELGTINEEYVVNSEKQDITEEFTYENYLPTENLHTEIKIEEDEPIENLGLNSRTENTQKSYQCNTCFEIFDNLNDLKQHDKCIHSNKLNKRGSSFRCKICSETFMYSCCLKEHKEMHMFECLQCSKQFSNLDRLKEHERNHTIVKPFCCDKCFKSYCRLSDLKRHRTTNRSCKNS